jgi:hypothetical protein
MPKDDKEDGEILRDILNRQIEVIERLATMETKLISIEEHTAKMNEELGECMKNIGLCNEDINLLKKKGIHISARQAGLLISGFSLAFTIIYTILKLFVFKAP